MQDRRRNTKSTYEKSTTCASKSGSAEKQSDAKMLFVSFVPHAQIKHNSREKPAFRDAQKEAAGEQSAETLREAHEGANDPPYEGESGKPESRRRALENDVTRDLEQGVAGEPDAQCCEVLVSGLFQAVRDVLITDAGEKPTHVGVFG